MSRGSLTSLGVGAQAVLQRLRDVGRIEHAAGRLLRHDRDVVEALTRVGKFLDEAMVSDAKTLRIVHGYGTGQLRG